ncbi:RecX family transcriptional regulator [Paenibacillus nasutitermitis]|uniref:Regulatory protein RecX n=1 Tax=Paenibacillus nasutitermitis TaxID=1652958 RepID=A0A917DST3_9BACL|nr:RecX family transcriptional regulator [Paenibacillus nasutitermitis]GGD67723.1 regulatory protein RecX [Paenibacillus nasutitermitis]
MKDRKRGQQKHDESEPSQPFDESLDFEEVVEEGMLLITGIEQDKKEKRRYHLYMNGSDEPLTSVHEDLVISYRLLKGRQIDPGELKQIADKDNDHRAYILGLTYLGARPRTEKEISRYLIRKGMEESAIAKALERLQGERLVDDVSYANQFAAQRMRSQLKGRRLLQQELEHRGISRETAKEASAGLDLDMETETAIRAAKKKWPYIKGEVRDRKRKLMAFLLRRGFPGTVVKQAVKEASRPGSDDE